jgi:glycosyltransferase involved in cell wall biosynthesis
LTAPARLIRVLGLSLYGPQAASHRVRLSQFQPGLALNGIQLEIQSLLGDVYLQSRFAGAAPSLSVLITCFVQRIRVLQKAHIFDLAIVYAELFPLMPAWFEELLLDIPYIIDFDDAFFLKYRTGSLRLLSPFLSGKFDQLLRRASAVSAGNSHLAAYARRFNANVTLLPSVVDTKHYVPADLHLAPTPFTVGWIGSPSTAPFLQALVEPLQRFAQQQAVRLLLVGGSAPAIPGVEVIEEPWRLESEVELIQHFSVGVMPLPDTPWARGKCAFKLIQCMACAIPVIASPVGANVDAVLPSCGLLASSADDWYAAFCLLAADPALRLRKGASGRQWVDERYSLRSALPLLERLIRRVADGHSLAA